MYKQAFGILNLKPEEFWALSWPEFWHLYQGWQIRRQYEFEHTRAIMAAISNAAFGQKRAVKPHQIMKLPEIDGGRAQYSKESMEAFIKRMSEREIAAGRLKPGQLIQLSPPTQE